MSIDFTQSPEAVLLSLINQTNGSALALDQLLFGVPTPTPTSSKNTRITLEAKPALNLGGKVVFSYDRVALSDVPKQRSKVFARGLATRVSDLIPAINAAYAINLTAADYLDEALVYAAPQPGQKTSFTVVATAHSLLWRGALTLEVQEPLQTLASQFTTFNLPGLGYPQN